MPVVRSKLLKLLSSQKSEQLLTEKGKEAVAEAIKQRTIEAIHWDKSSSPAQGAEHKDAAAAAPAGKPLIVVPDSVVAVHFNQMLVQ